jgi:hypothetical protein
MGRPDGKRPVRSPRQRRDNNIKMDIQEVGRGGMDCIDLAGSCGCGNEPLGSIKCGEFSRLAVNISGMTLLRLVS